MSKAKELYPGLEEEFYGPGDYQPIVDSFGTIILQIDDDDYQGDSRVLYKKGRKYGILMFGWGSCSGCDALQACSTYAGIDQLIADLETSIVWRTKAETLKYLKTHDWEGDYSWYQDETRKFVSDGIKLLEGK